MKLACINYLFHLCILFSLVCFFFKYSFVKVSLILASYIFCFLRYGIVVFGDQEENLPCRHNYGAFHFQNPFMNLKLNSKCPMIVKDQPSRSLT